MNKSHPESRRRGKEMQHDHQTGKDSETTFKPLMRQLGHEGPKAYTLAETAQVSGELLVFMALKRCPEDLESVRGLSEAGR